MNQPSSEHHPSISPAPAGGYSDMGLVGIDYLQRLLSRALSYAVVYPLLAIAVTACSSSSSSTPGTSISESPPPSPTTGGIIISGRITPSAASLTPTSAKPDRITATIQEVAISVDDSNYETIVTGPIQVSFDESSPPPSIGEKDEMSTGTYKALRLSMSALDWDVQWGFSNPSPCDGATAGSATGTLDLSNKPVVYFKTPDLGGNTLAYYQSNPPLSGYPGDSLHPLVLPAPIEIVKDQSTTVNLLLDSYRTLGCNRVSIFSRNDDGDQAPLREIDGPATGLYDLGLMTLDPRRDQIAVINRFTSSVAFFDGGAAGGNTNPGRILTGADTALNDPSGIAFYCPKLNPTDENCNANVSATDQYIVSNRISDSLTTYAANAGSNTAPVRSIYGYLTRLDQPSDLALNIDPSGNPAKDEMLVTNSGNDSVTTYARLDFGNSQPLRTIVGSNTGLAKPCGIAVDNQSNMFFVTNSDNNSITVYHTNDTGDIAPFITLAGSSTELASPCGIYIDGTNHEVIVANTGNDSILTFSNDASSGNYAFGAGVNNIAPIRSISGAATRIHQPMGVLVSGNELWVTHKGGQVAMALTPALTPVSGINDSSTNAKLDGAYNIIINGVDFREGVNGLGIRIPILFSDRGTAHFNSKAGPWPSFTFNIDSESRRKILDLGCTAPDFQTQNGFYGVGAKQHFYAATEKHQGIIDGGFVSDGRDFTSTFYSDNEIFVVYGTKSTDTKVQYLSSNGTDSGASTDYAYTSYYNKIDPYTLPITSGTTDSLTNKLETGILSTNPSSFNSLQINYVQVRTKSPLGYVNVPQVLKPFNYLGFTISQPRPYLPHAGGLFENADYGMAGISSDDNDLFMFMRDITDKDANNCPLSIGMGFGISRKPAGTYSIENFKGTYFLSGFGDKYVSPTSRPQYFSISGTLTFDGAGNVSSNLVENTEGELSYTKDPMTYEINTSTTGSVAKSDVIYIRSETTGAIYAIAYIARDGKTLVLQSSTRAPGTPVAENIGNDTRLLGYAILQTP